MTEQAKQDPRILSEADLQYADYRIARVREGEDNVAKDTFLKFAENLLGMVRALQEQNAAAETATIERLRNEVWGIALNITVELEYAKGREKTLLTGKYEGIKAVWELLGGDMPEQEQVAKTKEDEPNA